VKGSDIPMSVSVETPATEAIIIMKRTFDAPRAQLWRAFTDPKHVAQWYGGHGFSSPVCEMDVRPGGLWRHVMRLPDGKEFALDFIFVEVVPPQRLVWKDIGYDDPAAAAGAPRRINTVTFEENGRGTDLKLVTTFRSIEDRDMTVKMGFTHIVSQGIERLAAVLQTL
jgi:uncharacterized protein YndB with AHSA1/START domain